MRLMSVKELTNNDANFMFTSPVVGRYDDDFQNWYYYMMFMYNKWVFFKLITLVVKE